MYKVSLGGELGGECGDCFQLGESVVTYSPSSHCLPEHRILDNS